MTNLTAGTTTTRAFSSRTHDERVLRDKKEMVARLEQQNREIVEQIRRLRLKQMAAAAATNGEQHRIMSSTSQQQNSKHRMSQNRVAIGQDGGDHSPQIAGATIVDPLVKSLNELQTEKKVLKNK